MQLPVMDHRNRTIANPDAFAVNTAMQRAAGEGDRSAWSRAVHLRGRGLYLMRVGEEAPRELDRQK